MLVFVDTGAWLSVVLKREPHHRRMAETWNELIASGARFVTSNLVLAETLTRLRYDVGHRRALEFYGLAVEAEEKKLLVVEYVDRELFGKGWEIFRDFVDQVFSITDCTSFAVCKKLGVKRVLALDRDFAIMGFEVLPPLS